MNNHTYLEVLPARHIWLFGGGGSSGSSGGGGTTTTVTKNEQLPWSSYVPSETYAAYKTTLADMMGKSGQGLSAEEKAYYTGQAMSGINKQVSGSQTATAEQLARSGVKGGALAESLSDVNRSGVMAKAGVYPSVMGADIGQKNINTKTSLSAIGLPSQPVSLGGVSTTNYAPASTSGGGGS